MIYFNYDFLYPPCDFDQKGNSRNRFGSLRNKVPWVSYPVFLRSIFLHLIFIDWGGSLRFLLVDKTCNHD